MDPYIYDVLVVVFLLWALGASFIALAWIVVLEVRVRSRRRGVRSRD